MPKNSLLICTALLAPLSVGAQQAAKDSTLNRTVVVENQYNPEVMDAFKVNVLPQTAEPQTPKQHIDYATTVRPIGPWQGAPMAPMAGEEEQPAARRGYLRAAYGNRNNTDVRLSYLWDASERDRLGVAAGLYGYSGDLVCNDQKEEHSSRFFRTAATLDYSHRFDQLTLSFNGNLGSQTFTYLPLDTEAASPRQRFFFGGGSVKAASANGALPLDFAVQTGVQLFSSKHDLPVASAHSETRLHTEGFVGRTIGEGQKAVIGFQMDNLFYDQAQPTDPFEWRNNSLLQLNPHYTYEDESIRLRLGVHVDWQTTVGSGIKVAPDVALDATVSPGYVLYLKAGGGTEQHHFGRLNQASPYWQATTAQPLTAYRPIAGEAGLKASPLTGLEFRLFGGYRITKNDLLLVPSMDADLLAWTVRLHQEKTKQAYGGAAVDYDYKGLVGFSLSGTYANWKADDTWMLALKPELEIDAALRCRILPGLHANVSYRYEGRTKADGVKMEAVSLLGAGADYRLLDRLTVFARLNNLLGKHYFTTEGYPAQGFHALGGLSVDF